MPVCTGTVVWLRLRFELIAEISRLQNGGPEKPAAASIAGHVVQLQPLARATATRF